MWGGTSTTILAVPALLAHAISIPGEGKLSYLLGDTFSVVIHDGIIFSLPPTV
jgi:hypothetical protein